MRFTLPLMLLILSVTTVRADNNPDFDPTTICASIYQPVCAGKADTTRIFPNACLARRAGFTPVGKRECGDETSALPRFCTKEYAPVCGERDGIRRQFGNACEARAEDFVVVRDGAC
jgi:hypothetical protein